MNQSELFIDKVRNSLISISVKLADKTVKLNILRRKCSKKAEGVTRKILTFSVRRSTIQTDSADEKLKSLGHHKHHHSNKTTSPQLTPTKTETKAANTVPTPSAESNTLETVADVHYSEQSTKEDFSDLTTNQPDDQNMAERRPQRAGRYDNRGQVIQNDPKRRSRSEGRSKGRNPNKRNGEDLKGQGGSFSKESPIQQNRHSLYNEPQSDEGGFPDIKTSSSDSEETLQKKWIKNPNMVKQARKDKRKSQGLENGFNNGRPNYLDLQGNKENVDRGSQKGKYKRLEEMRKKRVDMAVTSDEELNSPEFRISRLRQRALQGSKLSSRLPDRLDEQEVQKIHMDKIASLQQNKANDSSSTSEQITLRPIGPGQGSFSSQYIQDYSDKRSSDPAVNHNYHGNKNVNIQSSNRTSHSQGPYRKIPKQETNFGTVYNQQTPEMIYYQGQPSQGPHGEFTWNFQKGQSHQGGYYGSQTGTQNEKNLNITNPSHVADTQKTFTKGKNKRKSHSDDSLDELIESNIQYLESERESGKLRKISDSQPRMFPTNQSDIYNKYEKRRSASFDSTKGQSSYQNEVKLRLQIPSSKEPQYDNRSIQSSQYDRLSQSTSESSTPPSVYTLPPNEEYIYQNTVPKVDRKFLSATHSPYMPRRTTELSNMEDISKSDSQLNWVNFGTDYSQKVNSPNYYATQNLNYHPSQSQAQNSQIPLVMSSSAPIMEGGMFSDVDYDIEVTDRIKKWEKYMKKKSSPSVSNESKSPVSLTTIMESEGGIPEIWTGKASPNMTVSSISVTVTKSVAQQQQPQKQQAWPSVGAQHQLQHKRDWDTVEGTQQQEPQKQQAWVPAGAQQQQSQKQQAWAPVRLEPRVQSAETDTHRMFRVVQQPKPEKPNIPMTRIKTDNIQKHANIMRRSSSKESDGGQGHGEVIEESTTKVWPPTPKNMDVEESKPVRFSRFEEELTELQEIKADSVRDLRKKFNSDASGNESTDITENATPVISTPLRQRRQFKMNNTVKTVPIQNSIKIEKVSSSQIPLVPKQTATQVTRETVRDQNTEVWSPKLESGQGPVSIERVKARTLQTIPFNEDPFWKQIEEMTSFDDLNASQSADEMSKSFTVTNNAAFRVPPSSSSIQNDLPNYSCSSYAPTVITTSRPVQTASATEQPKPKIFQTPTIQPLKLAIAAKSSIEALDEVLDDIRLSLQKKHSAPQRVYTVESSASSSSVQSPSVTKTVVRNIPIEKLNQNNDTGQNVSQKYFDQQKKLYASGQTGHRKEPPDGSKNQWIYPNFQQQAHSQLKNPEIGNQTHPNQQIKNQIDPSQKISNQTHSNYREKFQTAYHPINNPVTNANVQNPPQTTHAWTGNPTYASHPNNNIGDSNYIQYSHGNDNPEILINPDITQFPYIINGNYQLDPSVLKQKLMSTGLAFDQQSETDETLSQKSAISSNYADTEQQFNQSIEDLQNLARDVEDKLSQIKCKIVDADENRLDSILTALRKFAPSEPVKTPPNIQTKEEQNRQRAKLNEALTELDKIYYSLHLEDTKTDLMTQSQTLPQTRNISSPQIRRNKSDTGLLHYQEETMAQVEHQTQEEFDDITKSFQTLLDEVSTDNQGSNKPDHAEQIESTIESFLDEFRKTSDNTDGQERNINEKFESKLKDAKNTTKPNTCRDVQKSKVFTVSSGPFSALVGVKNKQNENRQQNNTSKERDRNAVAKYQKPREVKKATTSEPKVISSTAKIKLVSPVREIKVIKTSGSESEDISSDNYVVRKAKRNVSLQHRKSMPACMIQRTVETQTVEPSSPPVAVIRRQFQSRERQSREGSVSSESSAESRKARRKTISKGIALLMEFFSSSDDDCRSKHSTSAPDLRFVGCEKLTKSPSDNERLKNKGRDRKHKHSAKSRKRSSYYKFDNVDDKVEDMYVTSTTSDDNVPVTHGSKPPRHPNSKQIMTTSEGGDNQNCDAGKKISSPINDDEISFFSENNEVKRRVKEKEEEKDRPHSFHELLASFETNPIKLQKLRKCSSAEAMLNDSTLFDKRVNSNPELRKDILGNGANLDLYVKVKDTAV